MTIEKPKRGTDHTDRLVDLVLNTKYSDLPPEVTHATKRVILDTIGCCVAAFATDTGQMIVNFKRRQGGRGEATLLTYGDKLPVASVSYIHSQLGNLLDLEETLLHRTHLAPCIVMPALAMAELTGATGQEVIAAVALGFDIAARVGFSIPQYEPSPEGILDLVPHGGTSWAVFGTAAAAGRLLGLDHEQMVSAFGLAYVSTPAHGGARLGRRPTSPGQGGPIVHKSVTLGAMAEAGVNAAFLAADGLAGKTGVLDDDRAFWTAFSLYPADFDYLIRDLGLRWFISETSFKYYPAGRQGTIPVDLFLKIVRQEGLSADEIEEVTVTVPPARVAMMLYDNITPPSQLGPMSVPYACAIAALGIESGLAWISRETLARPELRAFARKVKSAVRQEWYSTVVDQIKADGTYRRLPTEVEIRARGKVFKAYAEFARGDPWGPEPMTDEELAHKFISYTADLIGRENAERAIVEALSLDGAADVVKLVGSLHR